MSPASRRSNAKGDNASSAKSTKQSRWYDVIDFPAGADELPLVGVILAAIAVVLLAWFVAIPLLAIIVDALLAVIMLIAMAVFRVVFRRPWVIEAQAGDGPTIQRLVVGWRASSQEMERLRDEITVGVKAGA
jgi:Flp pilus assembly protein TadB